MSTPDLRALTRDLWGRTVATARAAIDGATADPESLAAELHRHIKALPLAAFDAATDARERVRAAVAGTAPIVRVDGRDWLIAAEALYGIAVELADAFGELEATISHAAPYARQLRARDMLHAVASERIAILQDLQTRADAEWYVAERHAKAPAAVPTTDWIARSEAAGIADVDGGTITRWVDEGDVIAESTDRGSRVSRQSVLEMVAKRAAKKRASKAKKPAPEPRLEPILDYAKYVCGTCGNSQAIAGPCKARRCEGMTSLNKQRK